MNNYDVGQVLYMIGDKSIKVLPIQVVEEIIRTTMEGKAKSYMVRLPDKAGTTVDISEIKGKLFEDTTSLRSHMIDNATAAITKMINNAASLRDAVFEYAVQGQPSQSSITTESINQEQISMFPDISTITPHDHDQVVQNNTFEDIIKVDLGNGTYGTMKTDSLQKLKQQ